jgi:glycosyltransferase involved in cell wall biosynthesis
MFKAPVKRVLIIAPQPFYQDRGTPISVAQLATVLSTLGFHVDLCTYPIGEEFQLPNLRIFRCGNPLRLKSVRIGFSFRKLVLDLGMLFKLPRMLRRERYDVVHAVEEMIFPALVLAGRKTPVIYDMQSSLPDQLRTHTVFRSRLMQRLLRWLERQAVTRSSAVICSAGLLSYVTSIAPRAHAKEWKFVGLPPARDGGIALQLRESLGLSSAARVILYVGTFEPYQGIETLLHAMHLVRAKVPECVLVLIGATPTDNLGELEVAKSLVAAGSLHIVPRQPRAAIPSYFKMADVLVSPRAYGENIPLKIFDYMLAEKPIVATDIVAHRSVLNDSTAVLVDRTASSMAEGIIRLLQAPELGAALSAAALSESQKYQGHESFLQLVKNLYTKALTYRSSASQPRWCRRHP